MKYFSSLFIIFTLAFSIPAFAQIEAESNSEIAVVTSVDVQDTLVESFDSSTDQDELSDDDNTDEIQSLDDDDVQALQNLGINEDISFTDDLSIDEVLSILGDVELSDNNQQVVVGDVVISSEDFIILQTSSGEYLKLSSSNKRGGQRRRTGDFVRLSQVQPHYNLTVVPESSSSEMLSSPSYQEGVISSGAISYTISDKTKVIKNGVEVDSAELEIINQDDYVTVILDQEGELIAVTLIEASEMMEEAQETSRTPWVWIIGVAVVLIAIITFSRK